MASPRNGRPYRTLRAQLRQAWAMANAPCGLCGKPIDYRLRYPHRMSFSLDHIVPVWAGGGDKDPNGFRPSHLTCNTSRGQREGARLRAARRAAQKAAQPPTDPTWQSAPKHTSRRW